MKISEVLTRHDTDKEKGDRRNYHSYGAAYDSLFAPFDRMEPLNIVEIGVDRGGSLAAWREYFPNAKILGIDIVDKRAPETHGLADFWLGDVKNFVPQGPYDIVIDDGSHKIKDVVEAVKLFVPFMRDPESIIVIEDVADLTHWANTIHQHFPLALIRAMDRSELVGALNNDCLLIVSHSTPAYRNGPPLTDNRR